MKGKGFADVTEGVNSVQGSTLVARMAAGFYSLVAACCSNGEGTVLVGNEVGSVLRLCGRRSRSVAPCDSGNTRHEGQSQIGAHRQSEKGWLGVSVTHWRQQGAPCEVVPLLHVLARGRDHHDQR